MWILFAFGSAVFAGLTAILANAESERRIRMRRLLFEQSLY